MSLVSLVKVRKNNFREAILRALTLIDYEFQRNIKNIVIKPNMCYYWDCSTGQTTDPRYIGALIDIIRQQTSPGTKISIVEADASAMKCKYAFKFLGYEKLAREYDVGLVNLSEEESDPMLVTVDGQRFRFMVPRIIRNADLRLNVTSIKYSLDSVKMTSALKNIFGCNPYPKKYRLHPKLNEAIVALNKAMKFDLCLIDSNIAAGGYVRKLGLAMASKDPVAVDTIGAKIMGINPSRLRYLKLAINEGLGSSDVICRGVPIEYFRERYPRKTARKKVMHKAYTMITLLKLGRKLGLE